MAQIESVLGPLISFLVVLSIVVLIHELGHFLTAKLFRVGVEAFSLGFGKRLFGVKKGGTDYRVSAIPLGGFVKLAGEASEEATGKPEEFQSHPRWQRILVYVMGPAMNVLLAVFLFSLTYMIGVRVPAYREESPVIGYVEKGSPADKAGIIPGDLIVIVDGKSVATWDDVELDVTTSPNREMKIGVERAGQRIDVVMKTESRTRYSIGYAGFSHRIEPVIDMVSKGMPAARAGIVKGDLILAINQVPITTFQQASQMIRANPGKEIVVRIQRKDQTIEKAVVPVDQKGIGLIGISPDQRSVLKTYPFLHAFGQGTRQCWEMSTLVFEILKKYVIREMPLSNLSGPLDIATISYTTALTGLSTFLTFVAAISLQLGIINMLPIPILDGGHIFLLLIESAARRDLRLRVKERILQVGFFLLIALMAFVLVNDVAKLLPDRWYKYVPWGN